MSDHPLAFLCGTWEGHGEGFYPSIDRFGYVEVLSIEPSPKGFLTHAQRTTATADGRPLHAEVGYWRIAGDGRIEPVLVHPTGVAEVSEGSVDGTSLHLRSQGVVCSGSAKPVQSLERWYEVDGDRLRYRLAMGAVGLAHQDHLEGELARTR